MHKYAYANFYILFIINFEFGTRDIVIPCYACHTAIVTVMYNVFSSYKHAYDLRLFELLSVV